MTNYKIILQLILAGFLIISCSGESASPVEIEDASTEMNETISVSQKQFESSGFETSPLLSKEFSSNLAVTGMIDLPNMYKQIITSNIGGIIDKMDAINGHWVKKGDVLFTLTNPELITLQQTYLELQSQVDYMIEESDRQKLLAEENISAKKNYTKAKADLALLKAKVSGTEKHLQLIGVNTSNLSADNFISMLNIISPTSGYVSSVNVKNGGFLHAGDNAIEISSTYGMHLELNLLEKDIANLKNNQVVQYETTANPGKTYESTIHLIEKEVNENGYIIVHCDIKDADKKDFMPGMYVNAQIRMASASLPSLPEEAIVNLDNKSYVLVQDSAEPLNYKKYEVKVDQMANGFVAFTPLESIPEGSVFLSKGSYFLLSGE